MLQKITIFGPNLRDQSKGAFVVHAATCPDCKKLAKETQDTVAMSSRLRVSGYIWADMINEGNYTAEQGLSEIWFAPCVSLPHTT